ncbi:MAG: exopolysaccharide biosynthesis protein [Nitrospinae bacterium]|nr:exopolysaccharide biosynthesis protein [Nitrospinota bacterium]
MSTETSSKSQPEVQRFSDMLSQLVRSLPAEGLTLGELVERLGARGLLLLCMVLTTPFLLPVSIPGSSLPFGMVIALTGVGILRRKPPWLPARLLNRHLPADQLARVLEKGAQLFSRLEPFIHPRLFVLTHGATIGRLNGMLLVLSGFLLMAPLPLPLSNTFPAYGALCLAAGSLERDGYVVLAGYVMLLLTIAYFSGLAVVGGFGARVLFGVL